MRGLAEWADDGSFADKQAMWLVYSMNKEDIWVARIPLPIKVDETEFVTDDFARTTPGAVVPGWNLYSPKWAPVSIVESAGKRNLELRDGDPFDYARAVRVFPESAKIRAELDLTPAQANARLEIELCDAASHRPIRVMLTETGLLQAADGKNVVELGKYTAGEKLSVIIAADMPAGSYTVQVNGGEARKLAIAEAATTLQRLSLRTGVWRGLGDGGAVNAAADVPPATPAVFQVQLVKIAALGTGLAALPAAGSLFAAEPALPAAGSLSADEPTLGADYTVVFDHRAGIPMESGFVRTDAPSLARTSDGALLCAVPLIFQGKPRGAVKPLLFFRSDDGGARWKRLPAESDFDCGQLLSHGKALYYLGFERHPDYGMKIIRSNDDGQTWTAPVMLFKGPYHSQPSSYVIRNGQFYWCMDEASSDVGPVVKKNNTYVIAGDLSKDLLDPASWRISAPLPVPDLPPAISRPGKSGPGAKAIIAEGNVVEVNGRLQLSWRYQYAERDSVGIGVICDLEDDGKTLDYRFRQFYALPGSQCQFNIVHDPVGGLYWMNATLPTRTQDQDPAFNAQLKNNKHYSGSPGKERRILALYCSFDALNWLPAGYLVVWPQVRQASNYCGLLIDGDDLLVAARTSRAGLNQHDNDLTTFHRVKNFRERTAFLLPGKE
jgi:hypothetical protein